MAKLPSIPGFEPYPTLEGDDGSLQVNDPLLEYLNKEQQDIYHAYLLAHDRDEGVAGIRASPTPMSAFPVQPKAPEAPEQRFPAQPPAPGAGEDHRFDLPKGKEGNNPDHYVPFGHLEADGVTITLPDGTTTRELPPDWAFDPKTMDVYYVPESRFVRSAFLPIGTDKSTRTPHLAIPGSFHEGIEALGRFTERMRRGLTVPDDVLRHEAFQVANLAQGGGGLTGGLSKETAEVAAGARSVLGRGPQLGTAGGGKLPKAATGAVAEAAPTDLDAAGFFSQAQRAVNELIPPNTTGKDAWGILSNQGGVREAEVRQMGLDTFLLGPDVATARRKMIEDQNKVSEIQRDLTTTQKSISQGNNYLQAVADSYQGMLNLAKTTAWASRKSFERIYARAPNRKVTKEDLAQYVDQHRLRTTESVRDVENYRPNIQRAAQRVLDMVSADGGTTFAHALRTRTPMSLGQAGGMAFLIEDAMVQAPNPVIGLQKAIEELAIKFPDRLPEIKAVLTMGAGMKIDDIVTAPTLSGNPRALYTHYTFEPNNKTHREIIEKIDTPESRMAQQVLGNIPEESRNLIMVSWGLTPEELISSHGWGAREVNKVLRARARYRDDIKALERAERSGVFFGPHFTDEAGVYAFSLTSQQELSDGRKVLFANQIQSDVQGSVNGGRSTARNVMTESLQNWVDPLMQRLLREAVDKNLDGVFIPTGVTVNTYNPGIKGAIQDLYDRVYPNRMRAVIKRLDRKAPTGEYLTNEVMRSDGRPVPSAGVFFPITDDIRKGLKKGLRLMSGTKDNPAGAAASSIAATAQRPE